MRIEIEVGELVETFNTRSQYTAQAVSMFNPHPATLREGLVGIDVEGRLCRTRDDFFQSVFPVAVYKLRPGPA